MVVRRGGLNEMKEPPIPSLVMELLPRERESASGKRREKKATLKREKCYI